MYQTKNKGAKIPLATAQQKKVFDDVFHDKRFGRELAYSVVDDILGTGIVVYVDGDAAQGSDFGGELFQASVVLALTLVGFRHGGGGLG